MGADTATLKAIQDRLDQLYAPTPAQALKERPHKPVRTDRKNHPEGETKRIPSDTDQVEMLFQSPSLDTKGLTLHNVFASLTVRTDTHPTEDIQIYLVLEGSYGSAWCEEARSGLLPYIGPGKYNFGLVASDESLATLIRFRIMARNVREPDAQRTLNIFVDAMIAAGYQF